VASISDAETAVGHATPFVMSSTDDAGFF
jgi:hypothetical protein